MWMLQATEQILFEWTPIFCVPPLIIFWGGFRRMAIVRSVDWLLLLAAAVTPVLTMTALIFLPNTIFKDHFTAEINDASVLAAYLMIGVQIAILAVLTIRSSRNGGRAGAFAGLGALLGALLMAWMVFGITY